MKHILAVDGGGSHTRAGLYTEDGTLLAEAQAGGLNPLETAPADLTRALLQIRDSLDVDSIDTVAAGIAGAGISGHLEEMARLLAHIFQPRRVVISNDLLPICRANIPTGEGMVCVAGTGSSVWGRNTHGESSRFGGYGPVLGDEGSGYRIVIDAVRQGISDPADTRLAQTLLEHADLQRMDDFSAFVRQRSRAEIAALCPAVVALADNNHPSASRIVDDHAQALSRLVLTGKEQLGIRDAAPLWLHGGLFQNSESYRQRFTHFLSPEWPGIAPALAAVSGHRAAFNLHTLDTSEDGIVVLDTASETSRLGTEDRSSKSNLDALSPSEIFDTMHAADAEAMASLEFAAPEIVRVMEQTAAAFESGGRLIYLGAGTSGRLGVLDASECPPTFGVPEGLVIGIIAGGDTALRHSIEGAEDDPAQGGRDLAALDPPVNAKDVVVGITASGTAPYVLGGLKSAKVTGAATALICCNPVSPEAADTIIFLDTGPEVLPGSTRLKAGTATKLVLNQITTGAMARWGHIYRGYMVGVRPVNAKLRLRAIRITAALTGLPDAEAEIYLDRAKGSIPAAVLMAKHGMEEEAARKLLHSVNGRLRHALEKLAE
jgi:N-acetylmuramic acid 6-phosphate etherase